MNVEPPSGGCGEVGAELMQLVCGDAGEPSPALHAHLAGCPTCRDDWAEVPGLVADLRGALRPVPLPERVAADIWARIAAQTTTQPAGKAGWSWPLRAGWVAAAAAVVAVLLIPSSTPVLSPPVEGNLERTLSLSEDDAAAIAEAWALSLWDSPADDTVGYLQEQVDEVSRGVKRDAGTHGFLPWTAEEDWDLPKGDARSDVPFGPICRGATRLDLLGV